MNSIFPEFSKSLEVSQDAAVGTKEKWINKNLPGWSRARGNQAKRHQKRAVELLDNFTADFTRCGTLFDFYSTFNALL